MKLPNSGIWMLPLALTLISAQDTRLQTSRSTSCISAHQALEVAQGFGQLLSNYSTTLANELIADDYTDQSDSVNSLIDNGTESPIPLGNLTFISKAAYFAGQGSQPGIPFAILDTWNTCDTVFVRWVSKMVPEQVQGISIFEVQPARWKNGGEAWQIKTTYGEFNSAAWFVNLGNPQCG